MRKLVACDVSMGMNCGSRWWASVGHVEDGMDIPGILLLVLPFKQHGVLALVEVSLKC